MLGQASSAVSAAWSGLSQADHATHHAHAAQMLAEAAGVDLGEHRHAGGFQPPRKPPVARQLEYVGDSSRQTTAATCGWADSGRRC